MPISHTAHVTLNEPSDEIDLEAWLFGLSDADYQACAKGHQGAGVFIDEQGRGMINVESIGGNLIVQHYRAVRADRSFVEMYSPASRVYLFHLVPVAAAVRWTLEVTPKTATASNFACTVAGRPPTRPRTTGPTQLPRPLPRRPRRRRSPRLRRRHHAQTPPNQPAPLRGPDIEKTWAETFSQTLE